MGSHTDLHVLPVAAGNLLIDRSRNTVLLTLDRAEAFDLIGKLSTNLASFETVNVVIEDPTLFMKEMS